MKRWIALALLIVVALPGLAWAGGTEDAALALGAFAVFNQLIRGETILHDIFGGPREVVHERVVVQQAPPVVYAPPPPVVYAPPRPVVVVPPAPVVYAPPRPVVVVPPRPVFVTPRPVHVVTPRPVVVAPRPVYVPGRPVIVVPPGHKVVRAGKYVPYHGGR
jgi:hypothetical protein